MNQMTVGLTLQSKRGRTVAYAKSFWPILLLAAIGGARMSQPLPAAGEEQPILAGDRVTATRRVSLMRGPTKVLTVEAGTDGA